MSEIIIGSTFAGRYQVIEELGRGGMGRVYKAKDIKLKRFVALKFLPPDLTHDPEAKERFIHEAQAASALDHPNICTIHEIDETEDGQVFICMPYYEGETLKSKVERRPLKVEEAIAIAIQMVQGLVKAHEKGIIHRDIKSSNVMITKDGLVKIVDFGLAKLAEQTILTRTGSTMGTAAYMSPEQARGEAVDHRTDIWSLGVILYEMITGLLPFKGHHEQAILYSILNETPHPITSLRSGIPMDFERIVNKSLEKDPDVRYQTLSDLRADLQRLKRFIDSKQPLKISAMAPAKRTKLKISTRIIVAALVVVTVLSIIAIYELILKPRAKLPSESKLTLTSFTSGEGLAVFPSWSPDGKWLAYASDESGNMDIWKRPVEGGKAIQITNSPYNEIQPAWSPDGRTIAFSSDLEGGGIFLIPSEGGAPHAITDADGHTVTGANPTWSPDGKTIAYDWHGDIYLIPYSGGKPQLLVSGTSATPYMVWSPDGKKLIYWNRTKGDIYVFPTENGKREPLGLIPSGEEVSGLAWSKDGQHLFISRGPFGGNKNLWRVTIDPQTGKPISDSLPLSVTATDDIHCTISPDGNKLAYTVRQLERHLTALPINPVTGLTSARSEKLTSKSNQNEYPALSPDGRMLVWTSHYVGKGALYCLDLEKREEIKVTLEWERETREIGGSFSPNGKHICYSSTLNESYEIWWIPSVNSVGFQLTETNHPIRDAIPSWSPIGKNIAFYSNRAGNWDIWCVDENGNSEPKQLTRWESNELYPTWSPDGHYLSFRTDKEGNADIWIMDSNGDHPNPYVSHPAEEGWSAWSPDGRWFYFTSDRSGAFNIWVMPSEGGEVRQVTTYKGLSSGLPESVLYTKFAVSSTRLILPLENRKGNIYILENIK